MGGEAERVWGWSERKESRKAREMLGGERLPFWLFLRLSIDRRESLMEMSCASGIFD